VAGDDHGAGQAAYLLLQEGGGAVVEVVGRLVQQQRRRPAREQCGQGQPAALPAGQWLSGISVTDKVVPGYWEERGYAIDGWLDGADRHGDGA
jgi:hypothetical protein